MDAAVRETEARDHSVAVDGVDRDAPDLAVQVRDSSVLATRGQGPGRGRGMSTPRRAYAGAKLATARLADPGPVAEEGAAELVRYRTLAGECVSQA